MKFEIKHLPQKLDDVVFADAVVAQTLKEYANNMRDKSLLLYGPKGSGKSVSAQIVLKTMMGAAAQPGLTDPLHANSFAEKHGSFDLVLQTWSAQLMMGAKHGCVIFDELDQFTLAMQNKFRSFIDRYQSGYVIATTNNLHLIDGPLQDRFRCLFVEYPSVLQWVPRVIQVMRSENIELTTEQAACLLNNFEGSGRKLNDWLEDYILSIKARTAAPGGDLSIAPLTITKQASTLGATNKGGQPCQN